MKKAVVLTGAALVALAGCATHDEYYHSGYYSDRPDVVVEHPGNHEVIVNRSGDRTYVREDDGRRWDNAMQPPYRGKHPDALGWNDPYWYHY